MGQKHKLLMAEYCQLVVDHILMHILNDQLLFNTILCIIAHYKM